jgi:hydroxybutyrate-dimer hydrolase
MRITAKVLGAALAVPVLLAASPVLAADPPAFIKGDVRITEFDGVTDDVLTAGLGVAGLQSGTPPALSDPPTAVELRRLAIYNNYRALVDITTGGGYGTLYGPDVSAAGVPGEGPGMIAGREYLAFAGPASGHVNVSLLVQVPNSFDLDAPCIVTGPSSGSRGIYGAIGTSGEWGLKNGCAVAYTDKGTGTGAHDLADDTVDLIAGERVTADEAGKESIFTARINDRKRADYNDETPNRFAFKHAHSENNPEADWGRNVLQSIRFAFWALNEAYPDADIRPGNTVVIASSVSNGGGSSVLAAEQDKQGLIDGVAVSEPNVNPEPGGDFAIKQGDGAPFFDHSKSLYDYTTLLNLYQACANLDNPAAPFNFLGLTAIQQNRCASLAELGLLTSGTLAGQAAEAQGIINDFGILEEQNIVQPSHYWVFVPQGIAVTYANAYGKFSVLERLCGYSFGATTGNSLIPNLGNPDDGVPVPLALAAENALFATSNGIPPTGGVNLINDRAVEGSRETRHSTSPSTGRQDHNIDGNLCLRDLATGVDTVTGEKLRGRQQARHTQILNGIREIRASGDLNGKPAIFVTGRSDAILPPNHTSRAYFGLNRLREGTDSGLRYIEVLNAQHLDAFNQFPGFDNRFIPLHHYFIQALDIMFAHLKNDAPMPPSQVVRTVPRGGPDGGAPDIVEAVNLPAIQQNPAVTDEIRFEGNQVLIPE